MARISVPSGLLRDIRAVLYQDVLSGEPGTPETDAHDRLIARIDNMLKEPATDRTRARRDGASREEQHGRYLDCGPGAWDDR
jgi:hypothetical protein